MPRNNRKRVRNHYVKILLTLPELVALEDYCAASGETKSTVIRRALYRDIKPFIRGKS